MSKKIRKTIIFFFFLFFLTLTPGIIFYSQGYRFDFKRKKIVQTGGIFLKIQPASVDVWVENIGKKRSDFFFNSVFFDNLFPNKYKVRAEKEGYFSWEKNLEVKEKKVTDAKNIVLLPKNPKMTLLSQGVENFWVSSNKKIVVLKEREENFWILKIYDLKRNVKSVLLKESDLSKDGFELTDFEFSEDENEVYIKGVVKEKEKIFSLKIDNPLLTLAEKEEKTAENVLVSKRFKNNIYWLDEKGDFFKNEKKISQTPISPKGEVEYKLEVFSSFAILQEEKTLYFFDFDSQSFKKITETAKSFAVSPTERKLAYFSEHEIKVLFLKEEKESQPEKRSGEEVFIGRFSENINQLFWLTDHYLIFSIGEKIKVSEIDERDKINFVDLKEIKNQKIFWNEKEKKLFILSEKNLYLLSPLLI